MQLPARGLVLLDFTAAWCGPCKTLAPILESVAKSRNTSVVAIDVDADPVTAEQFGVRSMPTVVLWRDGKEVGRFVGARSKSFVEGVVDRAVNGDVAIAAP